MARKKRNVCYNDILNMSADFSSSTSLKWPAGVDSQGAPIRPRVLLVEDSNISQVLAAETLKALACDVVVVADGEAAVEQSAQQKFDMILMDCELPGIDGFEATQQIRRSAANLNQTKTPIIALTGNEEEIYRQRCLAAGMNGFLAKPLSLRSLDETLRQHLPNGRLAWRASWAEPRREASANAAAPSPGEPAIDRKALDNVRALQQPGAPDLVAQMVERFTAYAAKLLRDIEQAGQNSDAVGVKDAAHSLKSSAATVGANTLVALAKNLERSARQNDLNNTGAILERLYAEYEIARSALRQELSERQG